MGLTPVGLLGWGGEFWKGNVNLPGKQEHPQRLWYPHGYPPSVTGGPSKSQLPSLFSQRQRNPVSGSQNISALQNQGVYITIEEHQGLGR